MLILDKKSMYCLHYQGLYLGYFILEANVALKQQFLIFHSQYIICSNINNPRLFIPMPAIIICITIFIALLTFYLLISLRSKQKNLKKPLKIELPASLSHLQDTSLSTTPFLIFNSIKIDRTFTIQKGTTINKNFYIAEGQAEVLHNTTRIGIIKEGQITHNGFDFLGIDYHITKRAITDLRVAEVPETCDRYLALKILEKTCFEPSLRLCRIHTQVARLETIKTSNFEEFIFRNFKISNHKFDTITVENEVILEDCVYYVVSGSLIINGVAFEKNSLFGYFGVFFNYYKGFKCTSTESTILKYVPYSKLRNKAEMDDKLLRNLPLPMVYLGATADWRRVHYGEHIVQKNTRCEYICLVDGVEYGCKECILGNKFEDDLVAEKIVDVIRISKLTVDSLMRSIPHFYEELTRKMFEKTRIESKIVLITPTAQKCGIFIQRLRKTLGTDAIFLKNTHISEILGKNAFDKIGELVVSEYLNSLKERYKVVVVYLENEYSRMLKIIHPYCDIIFLVGNEVAHNSLGRKNVEFVKLYERRTVFKKKSSKIRTALFYSVFCDEESDESESDTEMLEARDVHINPLETCQHTDIGDCMKYKRVHHILSPKELNFCNKDYERFARYLTGERFGLVLGGGGARGYAHIGVIQALEEENIPIDVVGGTSMGAFVGALYARELDYVEVYTQSKKMSKRGASLFYLLMDVTLPFISLFSGRSLDRGLKSIFKDQQIQNFWLEYYCVTTNLKSLNQSVHFNGSAFKYIRSSMAVAGLVPPVFYKGEILCDGAYVNNVPTDVMTSLNVKNVITVKVCREFDNKLCRYDSLSGFILFFKNVFLSKSYLTLVDTQYRLSFLKTEKRSEVSSTQNLLITPDLGAYKASDFHKFDEIVACGYEAAKAKIKEWKASGRIKEFKKQVRRFSI
ncbi:uncharacterized protein VICG_00951 [Vittaforma corneae ATCC 50505]|uniref:PNPLA domain-containing protein n=1 Tax=Vittaforma corneae (strain ATCC 50505) TaxID=993615 RepID=L2GMR5_VITCO|nr:uncharacterized protein VICG_00951 [Vittaforma corneae ATCC 50505]ELA41934.1 hypothetical protein VICG_00951 [Vittaforma corneae ATCC 50505]